MPTQPVIPTNHPALTANEQPVVATLESGEQVTVLFQPGHTLYRAPGASANFGGVADIQMPECCHFYVRLKGGRNLTLFVNTETGLVTGAVGKGMGGVEFLRKTFPEILGQKGGGRRYTLESLEAPAA